MKLAFLSHTAMGGHFVVGSHHLASALATRGHDVLHVSAPVTPAHLLRMGDIFVRRRFARWWRGGDHLAGVRDVVPFSMLPWVLARRSRSMMAIHMATLLASRSSTMSSLRLREADCLLVDEPRFASLAVAQSRQLLVYRATDLYAQMRGDDRILDLERELCRRADLLIGTSDAVAAHLRALSGRHVHVIGNGVDFQHFANGHADAPPDLPGERSTRAIYVGAFDERFSSTALQAAAKGLPHMHFLLVGPGSDRVAFALGLPNILALGAIGYERLPAMLRSCAVGLLPLSRNAANAGRSPMKLFEYAAAGLCIAATSTLRPGATSLPTLRVAASDDAFTTTVARAFECAGDAAPVARARIMASAEDWNAKAGELLRLMQSVTARHGVPAAASIESLAADTPWS